MGDRASSVSFTPCPTTLSVPRAANTSRCFATTLVVPKIDSSYFKHFSLLPLQKLLHRAELRSAILCSASHLEIPSRN